MKILFKKIERENNWWTYLRIDILLKWKVERKK
jgi:hypothetical protein